MTLSTLLYIGTDDGLVTLKHDDDGAWQTLHHSLRGWEIPRFAVQQARPNRVVAGTRGDGVWVSEDFGETWKKPSRGIPGAPGKVQCVTIDPKDPDTFYAGAEPVDMFVSRDAGVHWTRYGSVWEDPRVATVFNPGAEVEPYIRNVVLDPSAPTTIYVTLHVGFILRSTDSGESWELLDNGFDHDIHALVIDPTNTNRIYLASGGDGARKGTSTGRALYQSEDRGGSWTPTAMNFDQDFSMPLVMHPRRPEVLFSALAKANPSKWVGREAGADSVVIRTTDGGAHWDRLENGLAETSDRFAEAIVFDEEEPDNLYLGLRSGELYATSDGGDSWAALDVTVPPDITTMRCVRA